MKKSLTIILALVMIFSSFTVAFAADPRLATLRAEDDFIPYKDGQFFTRYTPWLKAYHLMSEVEVARGVHGGEACQQIRCIDISPVNPDLAIFGTDTTGVWMTTDGGDFWYNTNRNIGPTDVADVMCHPTKTNIFLCINISEETGEWAPGIYRTEDSGRTWTNVYPDYVSSTVIDKLFAYDENGTIYAVTGHGVVKSTDDGKTWTVILANGEANSSANRADAYSIRVSQDGSTILVCYGTGGSDLDGLNVSYNGGTDWTKVTNLNGETDYVAYAVEVDPNNTSRWILSARRPIKDGEDTRVTHINNLFITTDGGASWTEFANGFNWNSNKNIPSGMYNRVYSQKPIRRLRTTKDYLYVCYASTDKAFRYFPYSQIDNAATAVGKWTSHDFAAEGLLDADGYYRRESNMYTSQGVDIEGDQMYVCAAGPHKYTFSTNTWERKSEGFSGNSMTHINMDEEGNLLLSAIDGGIVLSTDTYTENSPAAFVRPGNYSTTVATMAIKDPYDAEGDRIIAYCGNANSSRSVNGIIISEDGGKNWTGYDSEDNTFDVLFRSPINYNAQVLEYSLDPDKEGTIISSWATSPDNGATWNLNKYFYMDVTGEKSEKILAWDLYGADGAAPTYNFMYSSDGGATWKALAKVGKSASSEGAGFIDISDPDTVWYKEQHDFGTISISTGAKTSYKDKTSYGCYNNIAQNPRKPHHFILTIENLYGGSPTLMESIDHGNTWHVVPGYIGRRTVNNGAVTFSTTTDEVFLGSHSGIIVYEYEKFRYYQAVRLQDDFDNEILSTYELRDGQIIAPDEAFTPPKNHEFEGWEYEGELYQPGDDVKMKSVITYKETGSAIYREHYADGETVTLTLPRSTRPEHEFIGWKKGSTILDAGDSFTVSGDVSLEALWEERWNGKTSVLAPKTQVIDGETYYLISSAAELAWLSEAANSNPDINAKLVSDIYINNFKDSDGNFDTLWYQNSANVSAANNWQSFMIGAQSAYTGNFDGNGKTIYGLYSRGRHNGLFATVSGEVKNLKIEAGYIVSTGTNPAGSDISGMLTARLDYPGVIDNVEVSGLITTAGSGYYAQNCGGIVGKVITSTSGNATYIINSTSNANIDLSNGGTTVNTTESYKSNAGVGGVVGIIERSCNVQNCTNTGTINAPYTMYVGGVVGITKFLGTGASSLTGNINRGAITGYDVVGQIIGESRGEHMEEDTTLNVDPTTCLGSVTILKP